MKLEFVKINKSFAGRHILKDVSFEVQSGKAMGFLGRNGAGKTTTIRTLTDVFKPDSGKFLLDGKELDRKAVKIGYLPEERGMYQRIAVLEQLAYFGKLKGMSGTDAKKAAVSWLERMDLSDWASKNLETLSKGNQQKIQIIQAVMNDPEILVFDEPFSGLDPVNSKILKDIIREFIERGKIVIFSSHQMSYVEEFCDDVCFIKKGKIILSENLNELKAELGKNKLRINIDLEKEPARELLKRCDAVEDVLGDRTGIILQIKNERNSNEILKYLIEKGCTVKSFTPYRPSLEEIFIELDEEVEDEAV